MQRREFLITSLAPAGALRVAGSVARPQRPALIPAPQRIQWRDDALDVSRYRIEAPEKAGAAVENLDRMLTAAGGRRTRNGSSIVLSLDAVGGTSAVGAPEAYSLDVDAKGIRLIAPESMGLFYGVATLGQLMGRSANHPVIAACRMVDWPAYSWRGFMHDVGRNYQEMPLLRRFVDVMAQYKMNVFHFHLTDGPGYRIECRVHPELNAPSSYRATRCPGKFYTYAEINEFIRYCRQRHILVVPEIDMPGHSNYFNRAFGFDMQDERGVTIMEEVLNEFMDHVDAPYLHLGSDEVDVRNPRFMDRLAHTVRSRNRQVLAWRPRQSPIHPVHFAGLVLRAGVGCAAGKSGSGLAQ